MLGCSRCASQTLVVNGGLAGARESLTRPRGDEDDDGLEDAPLGDGDIADDDLGQFIRTAEEIELLSLFRAHLFRESDTPDDDGGQPET